MPAASWLLRACRLRTIRLRAALRGASWDLLPVPSPALLLSAEWRTTSGGRAADGLSMPEGERQIRLARCVRGTARVNRRTWATLPSGALLPSYLFCGVSHFRILLFLFRSGVLRCSTLASGAGHTPRLSSPILPVSALYFLLLKLRASLAHSAEQTGRTLHRRFSGFRGGFGASNAKTGRVLSCAGWRSTAGIAQKRRHACADLCSNLCEQGRLWRAVSGMRR